VLTVRVVIQRYTLAVLDRCGSKTQAAKTLGIGRRTLDLWLDDWGLREKYLEGPPGSHGHCTPSEQLLRRKLKILSAQKLRLVPRETG
jgi:hypothetical protein